MPDSHCAALVEERTSKHVKKSMAAGLLLPDLFGEVDWDAQVVCNDGAPEELSFRPVRVRVRQPLSEVGVELRADAPGLILLRPRNGALRFGVHVEESDGASLLRSPRLGSPLMVFRVHNELSAFGSPQPQQ
jgi:hypothetical protein